jgi:hypothetical protein
MIYRFSYSSNIEFKGINLWIRKNKLPSSKWIFWLVIWCMTSVFPVNTTFETLKYLPADLPNPPNPIIRTIIFRTYYPSVTQLQPHKSEAGYIWSVTRMWTKAGSSRGILWKRQWTFGVKGRREFFYHLSDYQLLKTPQRVSSTKKMPGISKYPKAKATGAKRW